MIERIAPYFSNEDDRGEMIGIMNQGHWEEFNFARTKAGVVRGNHYHAATVELFYIVDGELDLVTQPVAGGLLQDGRTEERLAAGDIFMIKPNTFHVVTTRTECRWINVLSKAFDPRSPDMHVPANYDAS